MKDIIKVPKILLPKKSVDMTKWAVIACDQFTSQGAYWNKLDAECGDKSALRIIFPEYYLDKGSMNDRIEKINATMNEYLENNLFDEYEGFILTRRTTSYGHTRTGIVMAVSLDNYDFVTGDLAIRATEATVAERLPVRMAIRENASLELPHVLLLIDDDKKSVIEPLYAQMTDSDKVYDFDLNMNGGHIDGYLIKDTKSVIDNIMKLGEEDTLVKKYGSDKPFLFAVGDGNHSVATAKKLWEQIKPTLTEEERLTHPAGYVLVEVVNLYDEDLIFEPIHRVVFGAGKEFIEEMQKSVSGEGKTKVLFRSEMYDLSLPNSAPLAVKVVQTFIDDYIANHDGVRVDYIHSTEHLERVCAEKDGIGIFMPTMEKSDLFGYVIKNGILPRKTFSMGEAEEKRYYVEARKIK